MAIAEGVLYRTSGDIVAETGQPMHAVLYAIKTRNIPCVQRVGNVRLFNAAQVEQIKRALAEFRD